MSDTIGVVPRDTDKAVLAGWWVQFNQWLWPSNFNCYPKPDWWNDANCHERYDLATAIMNEIVFALGDGDYKNGMKLAMREWMEQGPNER